MSTSAIETDEYAAATDGGGLVDRSERGKLALTGADAKEFLQGQVSNDVLALTPGSGCYAAFLTPKGKMLGDLRILDAGAELWLDTERVALQELFNLIRRFSLGYDVSCTSGRWNEAWSRCSAPTAIGSSASPPRPRLSTRTSPRRSTGSMSARSGPTRGST